MRVPLFQELSNVAKVHGAESSETRSLPLIRTVPPYAEAKP